MSDKSTIRTLLPFNGFDYNGCKNPTCDAFMRPPLSGLLKWSRECNYKISGSGRDKSIRCKECGNYSVLKSNKGIWEEFIRQSAYLRLTHTYCPNQNCPNHELSVERYPKGYRNKGRQRSGNNKYQCKHCKSYITTTELTHLRERKYSHVERGLFWDLCNDSSFRRIIGRHNITPLVLYDKIDFIHQQCLRFVALREVKMQHKLPKQLYVAMDKQDYVVNWSDHKKKKNVQLTAVCSVETQTGYCLGMHLNFCSDIGASDVYARALSNGDSDGVPCMRQYAQYYLPNDLSSYAAGNDGKLPFYAQLPTSGSQLHSEYTVGGHSLLVRHLLGDDKEIVFSLDGDSMLAIYVFAAFSREIKNGQCHVLNASFDKHMIMDDRKRLYNQSRKLLRLFAEKNGLLDLKEAERLMVKDIVQQMLCERGGLYKAKFKHPVDKVNEPTRVITALSPLDEHLDIDKLTEIYNTASIERLDTYF